MSQPTDSQPQASSPHAMPGGFTQTTRPLRLTTPLGPDKLLLECLRGEEGLITDFREGERNCPYQRWISLVTGRQLSKHEKSKGATHDIQLLINLPDKIITK
ncbi:hypothetical protein [Janthinobacterium rivuli]|uniref:hypothetical protein n=1 Tax=Janthinobacterium rivuli TaxID=2751478 RepID=UPI0013051FD2